MDFAQRNSSPASSGAPAPNRASESKSKRFGGKKWGKVAKWTSVVLLVAITVLIIAVIAIIGTSKTKQQSNYVNKNAYQAVFLNGGQVYFGKITSLTPKYTALSNIYYLRVNQTVQPNASASSNSNDVSLVKLGCELHGPEDQMVINNDQVIFWENLKSDGQVTKAIAAYQKANPNGQNCSTADSGSNSTPTDTTKKQ